MPPTEQQVVYKLRVVDEVSAPIGRMADAVTRSTQNIHTKFLQQAQALGMSSAEAKRAMDNMKVSVQQYMNAQGQVTTKVVGVTKSLNDVAQAAGTARKSWVDYAKGVFAGVGVYTLTSSALRLMRSALSEVGDAAIGLNGKLEQARIGFTTLLGSARAATDFLDELYQFALKTPFQFPELVEASKRLLAYGFAAKEVRPMLIAIGDATAALGTGAVGIERITLALGQMQAKGKVQGQELRQLGEAGIKVGDIMAMLAKKYGVSMSEIIEMQEAGALKAKDFIEAFKEYSNLRFGGMMAEQIKTFLGALSNLKDVFQMTIAKGFEPIFNRLSQSLQKLSSDAVAGKTTEWIKTLQGVSKGLLDIIDKLSPVFSTIAKTVKDYGVAIGGIVAAGVVTKLATMIQGLFLAIKTLNPEILVLSALIGSLAQVAAGWKQGDDLIERVTKLRTIIPEFNSDLDTLQRALRGATFNASMPFNIIPQVADYSKKKLEEQIAILEEWESYAASLKPLPVEAFTPNVPTSWWEQNKERLIAEAETASTVTEEVLKTSSSLREQISKDIGQIVVKMAEAGTVSFEFADSFRASLGTPLDTMAKVKERISAIGTAMKDMTSSQIAPFAAAIGQAMRDFGNEIINDETLLRRLEDVLWDVNAVAEEATNKKRWQELGDAIASGLAGIVLEGPKIREKEVGELVPQDKIDKAVAGIQKTEAEMAQLELQIARMKGVAKDGFDWKQPLKDGDAPLEEKKAKLAELRAELEGNKKQVAEWGQWNATEAERVAEGYQKVMQALGEYMAKKVLAMQLDGKISDKTAESLYKGYEKVFGFALSEEDKLTLAITQGMKAFEEYGLAGQLAFAGLAKQTQEAALAGKDTTTTFKTNMEDWLKMVGPAQDAMLALGEDGEAWFAALIKKIAESKTPLADFQAELNKVQEMVDKKKIAQKFVPDPQDLPADDLNKAGKKIADEVQKPFAEAGKSGLLTMLGGIIEAANDIKSATTIAGVGQTISSGVAAGMVNTESKTALTSAALAVVEWIKQKVLEALQNPHSPSPAFIPAGETIASGLAAGITSGADLPVAAAQNLIQRILDMFSGISVDPRMKETVDVIRGAIDAFASGLEALINLENYSGVGATVIEQAYSDMRIIIDRFAQLSELWADSINKERMSETSDAARSALEAFGSGIDALVKLADYVSPARSRIDAFLEDVIYVVNRIQQASFSLDTGVGDILDSIGNGLGSIIEPLIKISDYSGLARDISTGIAPALDAFMSDLQGLFGRLGSLAAWLSQFDTLADDMQRLGDVLDAVFSPLQDTVDVLVAIGKYIPLDRVGGVAQKFDEFQADFFGLFGRLTSLARWLESQGTSGAIEQLGKSLDAVFSPLSDVLKVLSDLRSYRGLARSGGGIAPALERFEADLRGMIGRLSGIATWLAQQGAAGPLKSLGEAMQSIFGSLTSVLDVIKKIAELDVEIAGFDQMLNKFSYLTFSLLIMMKRWSDFNRGAGNLPLITQEMIDFANNLSDLISPLDAVVTLIENITDLSEKLASGNLDLESVLATLTEVTRRVVDLLREWSSDESEIGEITPAMTNFSLILSELLAPMKDVVGITKDILEVADKLAESNGDINNTFELLSEVTRKLVDTITDWSETLDIGELTEKNPLRKYAETLSAIISPAQAAVSTATSLLDLADKLAGKTYSLNSVFTTLTEVVRGLVNTLRSWQAGGIDIGSLENNALAKYAKVLNDILSPLQSAIGITSSAAELSTKLASGTMDLVKVTQTVNAVVRALVNAIKRLYFAGPESLPIGDITDPQKNPFVQYATTLSKIIEPLRTAIDVTVSALDLSGKLGAGAMTTNIEKTVKFIDQVARALIDLVKSWKGTGEQLTNIGPIDIGGTTDNPLVKYAETLSAILSPLDSAVQIASSFADLAEKLAEKSLAIPDIVKVIGDVVKALVEEMVRLRDKLDIGNISDPDNNPLARFAKTLSSILEPMQSAISLSSAAVDLSAKLESAITSWAKVTETIDTATEELVKLLVSWFDSLGTGGVFDSINQELIDFATTLSEVLSPLDQVMSITGSVIDLNESLGEKIIDWTKITQTIRTATTKLIHTLYQLSTDYVLLWEIHRILIANQGTFVDDLKKAISPAQDAISVASAAADLNEKLTGSINAWDRITRTVSDAVEKLTHTIYTWTRNTELLAEISAIIGAQEGKFTENLSKALAPITDAISITSSAIDLNERMEEGITDWDDIISLLDDSVRNLLDAVYAWSIDQGLLNQLLAITSANNKEFTNQLTSALSPISAATQAVSALVDYQEKMGSRVIDFTQITTRLALDLKAVLREWAKLAKDENLGRYLEDFPKDFNDKLQNALGPIQMAVEALTAIRDYTGFASDIAGAIPAKIQSLANDVVHFVQAFSIALEGVDISNDVKSFGEQLGAIVGPVKDYIDAFYWIWRYTSIWERSGKRGKSTDMPKQFTDIAGDLKLLITAMSNLANEVGVAEMTKTASDFSKAVQPVVDVIQQIVSFLGEIATGTSVSRAQKITEFLDDFMRIIRGIMDILNQMGFVARLYDIGRLGGLGLIDGIIAGMNEKLPELYAAVEAMVAGIGSRLPSGLAMNASAQAAGGVVGTQPTAQAVGGGNGQVVFNLHLDGPIYAYDPHQIDELAVRIDKLIGQRTSKYAKVTITRY